METATNAAAMLYAESWDKFRNREITLAEHHALTSALASAYPMSGIEEIDAHATIPTQ